MTMTEDRPAAQSDAVQSDAARAGAALSAGATSASARRAMIDSQLRTSGVNEPWVLAAMNSVAREDFVPAPMRAAAYVDRAIALGDGRWLAAPLVHARMLAEAAPRSDDTVLLVGDGGGYLAALLRPLVASLDAVAPADAGQPGSGGHTLLVVDGAAEVLPDALVARLAANARIVTGLVERGITRLARGVVVGGGASLMPLAEIGIPVLSELSAPRRWSF